MKHFLFDGIWIYFASKLFIKLYNTQLRDLNDSKFKIVMKYILKLSENYYRNFSSC